MTQALIAVPDHGTVERYDHREPAVRCRCERCRAANAARALARRHGTWEPEARRAPSGPTLFDLSS